MYIRAIARQCAVVGVVTNNISHVLLVATLTWAMADNTNNGINGGKWRKLRVTTPAAAY